MAKKKEIPHSLNEIPENAKRRVNHLIENMIHISPDHCDPNGSYTGRPIVKNEKPVQDADDL